MILLYSSDETSFTNNGIGSLSDAVSCVVTEERNGQFTLEMKYPISGVNYSDLSFRNIIYTKPNPFDSYQPFRIYRITRPLNGIVTVYANHITYDLNGIPVVPFHTYTLEGTLSALATNAAITNDFTFSTDIDVSTEGEIETDVPYSVRNILGGMEGSVLQTYGGEYQYNMFDVALLSARGSDNGVVLRYGKNIVNIEQDEDYSNLYTGVAPYWKGEDSAVYLSDTIVFASGSYDFERILSLDLSEKFETEPTEDELEAAAEEYISNNSIGVPTASITIDYAIDDNIESVKLCDTVSAYYTDLGIQATAKCVKTVYNVLLDRYDEITLGQIKSNLADSYAAKTQNLTKRIQRIEADYSTTGEARTIAQEEIYNDTTILQKANAIIATALEKYVLTSDYETFSSSILTNLSVLAGKVETGFTSVASDISTLEDNTEQEFSSIYSFIRLLATITDSSGNVTQEGGIVIGESSSDIKLKLENDILYFFTGDETIVTSDNAIAWFASNQLYVNTTSIQNLTIGTDGEYLDVRIVGSDENRCVLWSGRIG